MRPSQENLARARGAIMIAVGALILIAYLISRFR
jgi:hypothetical protein